MVKMIPSLCSQEELEAMEGVTWMQTKYSCGAQMLDVSSTVNKECQMMHFMFVSTVWPFVSKHIGQHEQQFRIAFRKK